MKSLTLILGLALCAGLSSARPNNDHHHESQNGPVKVQSDSSEELIEAPLFWMKRQVGAAPAAPAPLSTPAELLLRAKLLAYVQKLKLKEAKKKAKADKKAAKTAAFTAYMMALSNSTAAAGGLVPPPPIIPPGLWLWNKSLFLSNLFGGLANAAKTLPGTLPPSPAQAVPAASPALSSTDDDTEDEDVESDDDDESLTSSTSNPTTDLLNDLDEVLKAGMARRSTHYNNEEEEEEEERSPKSFSAKGPAVEAGSSDGTTIYIFKPADSKKAKSSEIIKNRNHHHHHH